MRLKLVSDRSLLFAGILGLTGPITTAMMLSTTSAPWFNWHSNDMSDIGVSSSAFLFNLSLIVAGLTSIIQSIGIRKWSKKNFFSFLGMIFCCTGFASLVILGVINKDFGYIHYFFASVYYVLVSLGISSFGLGLLKSGLYVQGFMSISTSIASVILVVFLPHKGYAVPEVMGTLFFGYWYFHMALFLLLSKSD